MAFHFTFSKSYLYSDDQDGITVPVILSYGDQNFHSSAILDPGAKYCLFSNEIGLKLGISVERGDPIVLDSLGGPLEAYGHEVVLQSCGFTFTSIVYFARYRGLRRNLLGRVGWLRFFRIAIVDYDRTIYLSHYDD